MKMKEVCAETGLTERAVRLYCAEGLLLPVQTESRGRTYLDFDEAHIAILRRIAILRDAGFSIEEIRTIFDSPGQIMAVTAGLRARLDAAQKSGAQVLAALDTIDADAPPADAAALCELLGRRDYANGAVLRESNAEESYEPLYTEYDRSIDRGRLVMRIWSVVFWGEVALTLFSQLYAANCLGMAVTLALAIPIYIYIMRGMTWLRIFWSIRAVLGMASYLRVFVVSFGSGSVVLTVIAGLLLAVYVAEFYFLLINRWTREYFYDQRTR